MATPVMAQADDGPGPNLTIDVAGSTTGQIVIDLMPDVVLSDVAARLARMKSSESAPNRLRKLGLSPAAAALVMEWGRGMDLAQGIKALPARLAGSRPLDEAISVPVPSRMTSMTARSPLEKSPPPPR